MRISGYLAGVSAFSLAISGTAAAAEADAAAIGAAEAAEAGSDADADAAAEARNSGWIVVEGERVKQESSVVPIRKPTSIYGTEESILDTPRSITQVNAEQLAKDIILSSDDLAKYTPGITRGGGQNAGIVPQLRGQGSEIFQDGQRGYSVRHPANLNAYESADIVAGPSSVIFGSVTGSGGYVNYLTKKPDFDRQRTSLTARFGSWIPDGKSKGGFTLSADTTGPISETLAYRISVTAQKQDDYYDNIKNNYNAFYGALAWKPGDRFRADLNVSYDDYYDWNVTHGWNRATQELVDDGLYYAGRATPVIQNGSAYWSPVFASGAADSAITGWVRRARNAAGQFAVVPGSLQTANPNTQASPGTVRGWVYDPTLAGNELVPISRQRSQRAEDKNAAKRFTAQLRLAYSSSNPDHLLNVRASNMSALPDQPDHFERWLCRQGGGVGQTFASRQDYGRYLSGLLEETVEGGRGRLELRHDQATRLDWMDGQPHLHLASGDVVDAGAVVLALGNLLPHDPPGADWAALPASVYRSDPWAEDLAEGLTAKDTVLIIGTGLTMVDVVLTLEAGDFAGRIVALSRRGLAPRAHADVAPPVAALDEKPPETGAALLKRVRAEARSVGWHAAIDALRPFTQTIWRGASTEERARFLRHLRAWWDVHRHRLAPEVATRIARLCDLGRLAIIAGKVMGVTETGRAAQVQYRLRHAVTVETMSVRRIINCTGSQGDLLRTPEPLLQSLLASGDIRPDELRLGIDVNAQSEVIDKQGQVNRRLLALGPLTRGAFWEIAAVPDIRMQAWSVARRLSDAHWVEGEGL